MKMIFLLAALSAAPTLRPTHSAASAARPADSYAPGFYLSPQGDTIACRVEIPRDFGHFNEQALFSKVTLLDSAGHKKKYTPKDIGGYGFVYGTKTYLYISREVADDGERKFCWPLNLGDKVNEYYYYDYNTSDLNKGSMGATNEVYVLEDAVTRETVSITRGGSIVNNYKQQLRKFFENDKKMLALIVKDVKDFHDISTFVKDANSQP
jgi:hypothetical protein